MKIVVTGSSGFLGKQVVLELQEHGHEVVPVDLQPPKEADPALSGTKVADVSKPTEIDLLLSGVDAICHMGNRPSISEKDEGEAEAGFANNIESTFNVFEAAFNASIKKVIWASSVQAYGVIGSKPLVSTPIYFPVDEDHPLLPQSSYQISKTGGEEIAKAFARRRPDMQVFSLRFTYISGGDRKPITGDSKLEGMLFTHIDVAHAARAVRLCCEIDRPGHTALNIVSSRSAQPWSEEAIVAAYGQVPELRGGITPDDALFSAGGAREILGFEA